MKRMISLAAPISLIAMLSFYGLCGPFGAIAAEDRELDERPLIDALSWMAGHWKGPHADGTWEVTYSDPSGGMILGINKEVAAGRVKMFEFEQFAQKGDAIELVPYPNGNRSVPFALVDYDSAIQCARFENLEHDFPQVIRYQIDGDDLVVSVGNPSGEQIQGFQIRMQRD